jgi:hypothetical protein
MKKWVDFIYSYRFSLTLTSPHQYFGVTASVAFLKLEFEVIGSFRSVWYIPIDPL